MASSASISKGIERAGVVGVLQVYTLTGWDEALAVQSCSLCDANPFRYRHGYLYLLPASAAFMRQYKCQDKDLILDLWFMGMMMIPVNDMEKG